MAQLGTLEAAPQVRMLTRKLQSNNALGISKPESQASNTLRHVRRNRHLSGAHSCCPCWSERSKSDTAIQGSRQLPAVSCVSRPLCKRHCYRERFSSDPRSELGLPAFSSTAATEHGSHRIPAVSLDCQLQPCRRLLLQKAITKTEVRIGLDKV